MIEEFFSQILNNRVYLPRINLTDKTKSKINKAYLEFIISLAVKQNEKLDLEWFKQEIALTIREAYPNLTEREQIDIFYHIYEKITGEPSF